MALYSGQGKVLVADRLSDGTPGEFRFIGNVPKLEINLNTTVKEHKESTTGQRLVDARIATEKKASASFTMDEFTKENLAMGMFGVSSTIAAGAVTGEVLPTATVGGILRLANVKVSGLSIVDSSATPKTLVEGTDYKVYSVEHGSVQITNVTGFTQPFKAAYTHDVAVNTNMLTQGLTEKFLRFEGLNTADANKPVLIEIYRFTFDPFKVLSVISDDFQSFDLSGSPLYDPTKEGDAVLGQFGRVVTV